jgi:hypothetical protein
MGRKIVSAGHFTPRTVNTLDRTLSNQSKVGFAKVVTHQAEHRKEKQHESELISDTSLMLPHFNVRFSDEDYLIRKNQELNRTVASLKKEIEMRDRFFMRFAETPKKQMAKEIQELELQVAELLDNLDFWKNFRTKIPTAE